MLILKDITCKKGKICSVTTNNKNYNYDYSIIIIIIIIVNGDFIYHEYEFKSN